MKRLCKLLIISISIFAVLTGCGKQENNMDNTILENVTEEPIKIELSDDTILVDGTEISVNTSDDVYMANDIVFYLEGQGFTYGEGTEDDTHSQKEADKHTVVHITKPGTYALSGQLSYGQIAIDLGENSKKDESAVVNLILEGVDINCDVAPAVIFYSVYECGSDEAEGASKDVDTSKAGANIIIADDTMNNVDGSYVAKIYESYELSEDGTEVVESKKLHKYDAALYSKCTMNVYGGEKGNGILNIVADNEGLDTELHLTINGGNINIESGNDGINTNEDEVSVTTINGGTVNILVTGSTGEGDGIDSNGWLVINGGVVIAQACSTSGDAGIDSDMGIHINGGTVIATGNMLDRISESDSTYAVFSFAQKQEDGNTFTLMNEKDDTVFEFKNTNDFTYLLLVDEQLIEGDYTLWCNDKQCEGVSQGNFGNFGGGANFDGGGFNDDMNPEGTKPEKGKKREKPEYMEGMPQMGERPDAIRPMQSADENMKLFTIVKGANQFTNVQIVNS